MKFQNRTSSYQRYYPMHPSKLVLTPLILPKASEEAARSIATAIRLGDFTVGDKLPAERAIADALKVSRVTVREALRMLADAGLLDLRPGAGGGSFVASEIVPPELLYPGLTFEPKDMIDVLETRRILMPRIAEVAATNLNEGDISRMEAALAFARSGIRDTPHGPNDTLRHILSVASMRFDIAMAEATQNSLLVRMMHMLLTWLDPLRLMTLRSPEDIETAVSNLEDTLAALKAGDHSALLVSLDRRMTQIETEWERTSGRKLRRTMSAVLPPADA